MGSLVYKVAIADKTATKTYVYKDMSLDVETLNNRSDVKASFDYGAIQNGLTNLFLFAQGERIILPEFGNSLYKYLYEPVNDIVASQIGEELLLMFQTWEPRINIQKIQIQPDPEANQYYITVKYNVPSLKGDVILDFNTAVNARR